MTSSSTGPADRSAAEGGVDPALEVMVGDLAATAVFGRLDPEALTPLARVFHRASYAPGTVLAREGEVDRTLWVVVGGYVALQRWRPDGTAELVRLRGFGDCVGLDGVLTGGTRDNTAITSEPATLLYADAGQLWTVFAHHPGLLDRLVLPPAVQARLRTPVVGGRSEGEFEVARYRRHWIAVAPRLVVIPPVAFAAFVALALGLSQLAVPPVVMAAVAALGLIVSVAAAVWLYSDWWRDHLTVTNRSVIHSEETPFINASQSAARLDRIQDIRVLQPNLASRLLGYGDITIQTAGSRGTLRITLVPRPEQVRQTIFAQMDAARAAGRSERQETITRQILAATGRAPVEALGLEPPRPAPRRRPRRTWSFGLWTSNEDADGVVTWRKHWWVLLKHAWIQLGLWSLATVGLIQLGAWSVVRHALSTPGPLEAGVEGWAWILGILAWLFLLGWLWWRFEDWRNDIYQLTHEHVIDIERMPLGLFSERRQASLSQIQDVRFRVPNVVASLLNYGDVVIQTAAGSGSFTFTSVHRPASVQARIFTRMDERERRLQQSEQARRDEEMMRWVATYHQVTSAPSGPASSPPGPPVPDEPTPPPAAQSSAAEAPPSATPASAGGDPGAIDPA